jgi:hypothetical protein
MPLKSKAQRAWLAANRPDLLADFESDTPKGVVLPEHVPAKRKGPRRSRSLQGPPLR